MQQWPENLQEAISLWGETNCFSLLEAKASIKVQDTIRRLIEAGKPEDEIRATVSAMKIDARISVERDPVAATVADLKKMDPEQRKLKIAELMKQMKELNAAG
jgi:hypothetical protein